MRRVESYPHFTNEATEAPRAEMTCPSDCYGMGQGFLTQLCLMPKPGPVQNPAGSRARAGQSSALGGGGGGGLTLSPSHVLSSPPYHHTGWVTRTFLVLALQVLLPGKPLCPGQTRTGGHSPCRWPSQGLQAPPGAQTGRSGPANPPHLHT